MNRSMLLVASLLAFTVAAQAEEKRHHGMQGHEMTAAEGGSVTLEGEVLDMVCYIGHEGQGKKHAKCAKACLLKGAPSGLLTEDGSVYLLVEDHHAPRPYEALRRLGGERVKVTGKLQRKKGVQGVVVEAVEEVR